MNKARSRAAGSARGPECLCSDTGACVQVRARAGAPRPSGGSPGPRSARLTGHARRDGLRGLRTALNLGRAELQRVRTEPARTEKLCISKKTHPKLW